MSTTVNALLREDLREFGGYKSARSEALAGSVWLNANESAWANGSDADGRLLDATGHARDDLRVMGSLRIGEAWETIAVPELRLQAAAVAAAWTGPPGSGAASR